MQGITGVRMQVFSAPQVVPSQTLHVVLVVLQMKRVVSSVLVETLELVLVTLLLVKLLKDLFASLSKLKIKPIISLAKIFKALPGQILSIAKGAKGLVGTLASAAKSGILNFNLGKLLAGAGKGLAGGASAVLKGGKGVLERTWYLLVMLLRAREILSRALVVY